jgi:hypothetical protein
VRLGNARRRKSPGCARCAHAYAPGTVHAEDPGTTNVTVHGNSALLSAAPHRSFPLIPPFASPRDAGSILVWTSLCGKLDFKRMQGRSMPRERCHGACSWSRLRAPTFPTPLMSRHNVVRACADAYPPLPLCLSTGTQFLTMNELAHAYVEDESEPNFIGPSFDALRWETRLESALGLHREQLSGRAPHAVGPGTSSISNAP